jgi:hypothetical protein
MRIYHKLQAVRDAIRALNLKPTGVYKGTDRKFFQKSDFWSHANDAFKDQNIMALTAADKDAAQLVLIDLDGDGGNDNVMFRSPMSTHNDRALSPVQNLGWAQSYLYRRLYITALELVEDDPIDGTAAKPSKAKDVADRFNDAATESEPKHVREGAELPPIVIKRKQGVRRGK